MAAANTTTIVFAAASLVWPFAATANDTEAEIGVGDLNFTKSRDVKMVSEELFVSREQIAVKYLFRNTSGEDVRSLVAFPLPEFKAGEDRSERGGISDVDFQTTVDGRPVSPDVEKRAFR